LRAADLLSTLPRRNFALVQTLANGRCLGDDSSPDRVDTLVWALSDLFVQMGKDDGYIEWLREAVPAGSRIRRSSLAAGRSPDTG
jgi:hypothetical protein